MRVPRDHEVQPIRASAHRQRAAAVDLATCGTCGRSWDDGICTGITPAPSGRCPFEYFHGRAPAPLIQARTVPASHPTAPPPTDPIFDQRGILPPDAPTDDPDY